MNPTHASLKSATGSARKRARTPASISEKSGRSRNKPPSSASAPWPLGPAWSGRSSQSGRAETGRVWVSTVSLTRVLPFSGPAARFPRRAPLRFPDPRGSRATFQVGSKSCSRFRDEPSSSGRGNASVGDAPRSSAVSSPRPFVLSPRLPRFGRPATASARASLIAGPATDRWGVVQTDRRPCFEKRTARRGPRFASATPGARRKTAPGRERFLRRDARPYRHVDAVRRPFPNQSRCPAEHLKWASAARHGGGLDDARRFQRTRRRGRNHPPNPRPVPACRTRCRTFQNRCRTCRDRVRLPGQKCRRKRPGLGGCFATLRGRPAVRPSPGTGAFRVARAVVSAPFARRVSRVRVAQTRTDHTPRTHHTHHTRPTHPFATEARTAWSTAARGTAWVAVALSFRGKAA